MKKFLTNNIGLKIISLLTAVVLWMVIINIDDPVISKTYSGIQVEMINPDVISDENKTYEVNDGSDVISVTVTAERSIIENMSKDYIKATADLKQITFMNSVPIEIKSSRYSDRIKSLTSKTTNVQVEIENRIERKYRITIQTTGEVADGYVVGNVTPNISVVTVSGPESVMDLINEARIDVNLDGMNESYTDSVPVILYGSDGEIVEDSMIKISQSQVLTNVQILDTKEIPITASATGIPAAGFSATGTVICEPSSVIVAGSGAAFDNLTVITVPESEISLEGATDNVISDINIKQYLPKDVILADGDESGSVTVIAVVEAHDVAKVSVPYSSIVVENLPEGYTATVLHESETIEVSVSGLSDALSQINAWTPHAKVDVLTFIPKPFEGQEVSEDDPVFVGINEGTIQLELPEGIYQVDVPDININISRAEETQE